jgi:hypothetical protein
MSCQANPEDRITLLCEEFTQRKHFFGRSSISMDKQAPNLAASKKKASRLGDDQGVLGPFLFH